MPTKERWVAVKHDGGKPRVDLVMGPGFLQVADVLTYGATKYGDYNYLNGGGLSTHRLVAAAVRHITARLCGQRLDEESGLDHLAHAAASLLMTLDVIAWSSKKADTLPKGRNRGNALRRR